MEKKKPLALIIQAPAWIRSDFACKGGMMKNRKKWLLPGCGFAIALALVIAVLFSPRPIVENPDTCRVARIQYNHHYGEDIDGYIEVEEYEEKAILDYLSQCTERRTLDSARTYLRGNVEIDMIIDTENGMKHIILGKENSSSASYGSAKYVIFEGDSLRTKLLEMMTIPVAG